jgi:glc operon protein GlcG
LKRLAYLAVVVVAMFGRIPESDAQAGTELNAASAQNIIAGCVKHSTTRKQSHAVAVVDGSGGLLAFLRMDGNPPGVGAFALQKAMAVASWRFSTEQMSKSAESTPGFSNAPNVVTVAGGVPIYSPSGEFLGSVGVSGESPQDDAACAIAGVRAAGLKEVRNF